MPYRHNNYSFVIDSSFQPMSLQEMMTPMMMYKEAYEKDQAVYDELNQKAGDFKYLAETLPEGSKARAIYEGYANDLYAQAKDFSQNGLSMNNRRALNSLKRRYSGEIGRLEKANVAMDEERKLRRANKDTSMLYATDNLNIDQFLDGANPNLYSISGEDLRKEAAQYAQAASSRIYGNSRIENINKYFQDIVQTQGYSPEVLAAWRQNLESIPEFNQAVDDIMVSRGVKENLTGANYERARQNIINGIMEGSVYQEKRQSHQNPGVLTAAQAASNALGWANHNESVRQHDLQMKMRGYTVDKDGNVTYDPDKDAEQKRAEASGYNPDEWGKGPDGKWHKKARGSNSNSDKYDLLEDESSNTSTGNRGPVPSGKDASWGTPISKAEAMELDPELVAECGKYSKHYKFYKYKNSAGQTVVVRRRVKKTVSADDTDDVETSTSTQKETGNGSNHNEV